MQRTEQVPNLTPAQLSLIQFLTDMEPDQVYHSLHITLANAMTNRAIGDPADQQHVNAHPVTLELLMYLHEIAVENKNAVA